MPDYNQLAASTLSLIERNGRALPITRKSPTIDKETGEQSATASQTGEIKAVVLPGDRRLIEGFSEALKADLVKGRVRKLLVAAKGVSFEPAALDEITFDGSTWAVFGVDPLSPAGIPLLYTVGVSMK